MAQDLARAVLGSLPPELLEAGEVADFEANAALWRGWPEPEAPDPSGGYGFGLESVLPEATQLALLVGQTVLGVLVEAGLRGWWQRMRKRSTGDPDPEHLLPAQVEEVRRRVVVAVRGAGADADAAALYADAAVAALRGGPDLGAETGDGAGT